MKILLIANSGFKLTNFRAGLIRSLISDGHELVAAVPSDNSLEQLKGLGVKVVDLTIDSAGTSPLREALLLLRVFNILRSVRPDAALGYTIKPNIYGALSARFLRIPFFPNVTGLGTAFDSQNLLRRIVKSLYRIAFRKCPRVFLQNPEDLNLFVEQRLINLEQAVLLPGSGVDLTAFSVQPLPGKATALTFLLVARMLRPKGVVQFAEAAYQLSKEFRHARFVLLGPLGDGKADGLSAQDMKELCDRTPIEYVGSRQDVRPIINEADCVVLPSYYNEGTPRSLLEAGATGRPIITSDWPGCRDVIEEGYNGYLCQPKNSKDLADKMRLILLMSEDERQAMGFASRARMENSFDEKIIINAYKTVLSRI